MDIKTYVKYVKDQLKFRLHIFFAQPNIEPDFNNSKKILDQRRFWFRSQDYYDKTLITNKPLNWTIGLHTCYDPIDTINSDLLLIHLHRFDYRICIDRHLKYASLDWSDNTIINNYNWHYRKKEEESIRKWYFSDINNITEIPNELKVQYISNFC